VPTRIAGAGRQIPTQLDRGDTSSAESARDRAERAARTGGYDDVVLLNPVGDPRFDLGNECGQLGLFAL